MCSHLGTLFEEIHHGTALKNKQTKKSLSFRAFSPQRPCRCCYNGLVACAHVSGERSIFYFGRWPSSDRHLGYGLLSANFILNHTMPLASSAQVCCCVVVSPFSSYSVTWGYHFERMGLNFREWEREKCTCNNESLTLTHSSSETQTTDLYERYISLWRCINSNNH